MCVAEKKRLPVGIESFEEIRTDNYYYVDKTAMIRELLQRRGKVNLFTQSPALWEIPEYEHAQMLFGNRWQSNTV